MAGYVEEGEDNRVYLERHCRDLGSYEKVFSLQAVKTWPFSARRKLRELIGLVKTEPSYPSTCRLDSNEEDEPEKLETQADGCASLGPFVSLGHFVDRSAVDLGDKMDLQLSAVRGVVQPALEGLLFRPLPDFASLAGPFDLEPF